MKNPLLFLEYPELDKNDFENQLIKVCFLAIKNLYEEGAKELSVIEVDSEIEKWKNAATAIYKKDGGLDFITGAYEVAEVSNFEVYYNRLKKMALMRRLVKEKYDVSDFFIEDKDVTDPLQETAIRERYDNAKIEDILNAVEGKYNIIRNDFLNGGKKKGDPAEGVVELVKRLQETPDVGPPLEGKIFNGVFRGARTGCFFLKAASTSAGKTRTSVFDACKLAYPERWNYDEECFIEEIDYATGELRAPRKVLFIVTEMDKEELQTIMLAYLSGVNEDHIIRGNYEFGELERVHYAAHIMQQYAGTFIIEEISEPNLVNVEATIKRYATVEEVKYVFFDYIHTTASLVGQFAKNNLREDVVLMLLANQLKQIAKDYGVFVFSATQVNANAMGDDESFKNESCIRGAKSIADKADAAYIMTRVSDKMWNSMVAILKSSTSQQFLTDNRPTHVLDVYKMRRGRYKNVRIWTQLDLGNGQRKDLFLTSAENQFIDFNINVDTYNPWSEKRIDDWKERCK